MRASVQIVDDTQVRSGITRQANSLETPSLTSKPILEFDFHWVLMLSFTVFALHRPILDAIYCTMDAGAREVIGESELY